MNCRIFFIMISLMVAGMTNETNGQQQRENKFRIVKKTHLNYLSWVPADYSKDKSKQFPLIIFLHGSGERGNNLELVRKWGPPSFVEQKPGFPFIVLSPQCPEDTWWNVEDLDIWLDRMMKKFRIDPARVYLTGLSMGGFGTWSWACARPERFAAIAPVCGGGDIQFADRIKNIPVWAFHGADDPVVPADRTIEMVDALRQTGARPVMTIYPGVGHDSWIPAYNDEKLYRWMLDQHK